MPALAPSPTLRSATTAPARWAPPQAPPSLCFFARLFCPFPRHPRASPPPPLSTSHVVGRWAPPPLTPFPHHSLAGRPSQSIHFLSGRTAPMRPAPPTATAPDDDTQTRGSPLKGGGGFANGGGGYGRSGYSGAGGSFAADTHHAVYNGSGGATIGHGRGHGGGGGSGSGSPYGRCGLSPTSKLSPIGGFGAGLFGGSAYGTAGAEAARHAESCVRAIRTAVEAADAGGSGLSSAPALLLLCRMHGVRREPAELRALLAALERPDGKLDYLDFLRRLNHMLEHDPIGELATPVRGGAAHRACAPPHRPWVPLKLPCAPSARKRESERGREREISPSHSRSYRQSTCALDDLPTPWPRLKLRTPSHRLFPSFVYWCPTSGSTRRALLRASGFPLSNYGTYTFINISTSIHIYT